MKTVSNGSNVTLHYKGTLKNGEVFDDSKARGSTMSITVGQGRLIKGFESALIGMSEGQTKSIALSSDEAYGPVRPDAIVTAPKSAFPEDFVFQEGVQVTGRTPEGQMSYAKIISFTDTEVTLDHNHPLAGKDLNFQIELVEIDDQDSSAKE
tara:strand:- start:45 stop:500 length:456 start_codon:yes stop_codon:yes gene_type:complete